MNITRLRPLRPTSASPATSSKHIAGVGGPEARLEASALLAEILACLHAVELPIVQFMPACLAATGNHVSLEFAAAAASRFGRTLLLNADTKYGFTNRLLASRGSSRKRRTPAVVPDSDVPGLYHRQESGVPLELIAAETPDTQPFRMMVVQSAAPTISPIGLNCAGHCSGTILTVAAGITRLPELQAAIRQIGHTGGTLLGAVLFDAPIVRLPFSTRTVA